MGGSCCCPPAPERSTHSLREQGQKVPAESGMAKGCPTNTGQPARGLEYEAEAGVVTVPILAHGITQWPGAAGHLPLPTSASSSSTPGSSVGTSSRFSLGADPATKRGMKTPVGTWLVGTARAQGHQAEGHPAATSAPAPQDPGAHG